MKTKLAIVTTLLFTGCATADLRSEQLRDRGLRADVRDRGHAILDAMVEAHGLSVWQSKRTTEVTMRDDWDSALATLLRIKPWDDDELLRFRIENGTFNTRVDFLDGPRKGAVQGMQAWRTYTKDLDSEIEFEDDKDIRFFLPAITYFVELPFRLHKAPVVSYEGEEMFKSRRYDKVLVTWQSLNPNEHDQYVVWINQTTGLMDLATFTIREQGDFFKSTIYFDEYREVDGVQVAFRQTIADFQEDYGEDYLHQIRLEEFSFDSFDRVELHPDAKLAAIGDSKPES